AEEKTPVGDGSQSTAACFYYGLLDELLTVKRQVDAGVGEQACPATAAVSWPVGETDPWKVERQYDENLNLTAITDPVGNVTEIDYDARNLPKEIRSGLGDDPLPEVMVEVPVFDVEGRLTTWTNAREKPWTRAYDGYGRLRESRDPLDNYSTVSYDTENRTVRVERFDVTNQL
ncbi:MAG: RHS repeat protein, partial [Herbaspirillum sp.]|uniref:RHS repeat domain-containing protein n=1 Tax=Herbaspirillum sp. TaxID=1890675 RepID=UPI002588CA0E